MLERHVTDDLVAYLDRALPRERAQRVESHVAKCERCRTEYDGVVHVKTLLCGLKRERAPESLWSEIEDKWQKRDARRYTPSIVWAVAAGLLFLLLGAAWFFSIPSAGELDLGEYLRPVQAAPRDASLEAIVSAPPGFEARGRAEALETAGVGGVGADSPLPGYSLLTQRASRVRGNQVVQLVYASEGEAFSVFVAPARIAFRFGKERAYETEVEGVRCSKVDCPYQETYGFTEGRRRWVLVSKTLDPTRAATVMQHFMSANRL